MKQHDIETKAALDPAKSQHRRCHQSQECEKSDFAIKKDVLKDNVGHHGPCDKRQLVNNSPRTYFNGMVKGKGRARVIRGDCSEVISTCIPTSTVNLIVTSPPYADRRVQNYGGIHPDAYVDWFLPKAEAFKSCLTDDGSFVLNIKEKAVAGEKHRYVYELVLALRDRGWRLVDEYCWHKKNCYPGKWPNRFRDSWERIYHFTLNNKFKMNQESVMVPMGEWREARLANLSENDGVRYESRHANGFSKRVENWVGRDMAYPTNVLYMATECGFKDHPAPFPKSLPAWFIRLFTDPSDIVLDPFAGSGTTLVAALELGRNTIGIDLEKKYCEMMQETIIELS